MHVEHVIYEEEEEKNTRVCNETTPDVVINVNRAYHT